MAPFEMFYDALADSKHLKTWLTEQLKKSSAFMANLERQQAHMEDMVSSMVEKRRIADVMDELVKMGAEDILIFNLDNCRV